MKCGSFKLIRGKKWTETNSDGSFNCEVKRRDSSSIYLTDLSRGYNIKLDLKSKKVLFESAGNYVDNRGYNITAFK